PNPPAPTYLYSLPGSWTNLSNVPTDGAATLRLRVQVPLGRREYGLFVPSFNTAYAVWVNGEPAAASGQVAATAEAASPAGYGQLARFISEADSLDIVVHVSSFEGVPGGPIARFALGAGAGASIWDNRQIGVDLFVVSTCFIIGLYYLGLYLLRRKEGAFLWFGLVCVIIAVRGLFVGREVIHLLWRDFPWRLSLELIFVFGQLLAPLFAAFASALFPKDAWPRVTRTLLFVGLGLAVIAAIVPPAVFFALGALFNGFSILAAGYTLVVGVRAARNKRAGALLLLLSTVPLLIATIVEALGFLRIMPLYSVAGFGILGTIVAQMFTLSRNFTRAFAAIELLSERLERTNKAYYRFVPREFLQLVGKEDIVAVELGDQIQRTMTVLFSDVRNFTSLSEKMSPEENFRFINDLLGTIGPIIREHHGFIDKYMGDGIMALFSEQPGDALRAAIAMRRSLTDFNVERAQQGEPPIRIGVGLHCGSLMLGTVGEPERMDGTVIADAVNTASRLESLTKLYGVSMIASEQVLESGGKADGGNVRMLGRVRAKGKQESLTLYEIFDGDPAEVADRKNQTRAHFEQGLSLYQGGQFAEAKEHFDRVAQFNPDDPAAAYYAKRSAQFAAQGGPPDWDGAETMTEK
ncbi:MAG TPA: adenylate/guanylate cyclase domain-containing protein, partial [Anaerolineales bacterium]|nr:adenylate/guanylate cyclase domain-containing protein [Anaerolineales bacterium]